jgi:hypothetical protein
MPDICITLSQQEMAELLMILEHELEETRVEVHRTHTPAFRDNVQKEEQTLRSLLNKLRQHEAAAQSGA